MDDKHEESAPHPVCELLDTGDEPSRQIVRQTVAGIVSVTVDSTLRLRSVQLLAASMDGATRESIEKAIVQAVNRAMLKVVRTLPASLTPPHESGEWQGTMARLIARGDPP